MSLLEQLIKEEKRKKRKRRLLFGIIVAFIIVIFNLKNCDRQENSGEGVAARQVRKKSNPAAKDLSFDNVMLGEFEEEKLDLKAYQLLIVSELKQQIETTIDLEKCRIEFEIDWKFRWYPKSGEIKNNRFSSTKNKMSTKLKNCLKSAVDNLNIKIENKLEIAYISLELKLK